MGIYNLCATALNLTPRSLARPVSISDQTSRPRFWATVYELTALSKWKNSTVSSRLVAIDALYRQAEQLHGADCLDTLLADFEFREIASVLESFFMNERNRAARDGSDTRERWFAAKAFVFETLSGLVGIEEGRDKVEALKATIQRLETRLHNFSPNPPPAKTYVLRALPSAVVADLYEIFDPTSSRNPFRGERRRHRNFCILLLLLHQGLRRSEALLLPSDAVKSGTDEDGRGIRFWINVENRYADEDPRYCDPPSIKNDQSIRQIPMAPAIAAHVEAFAANYRGRSAFPHLILNGSKVSMGTRGFSKVFERASKALSPAARKALDDNLRQPTISAHDLRHTCAVVRLAHLREAGVSEADALSKLRAFFGWSYESEMPRWYARAYWERQIPEVWNDQFDAHVDALRALEPGGWEAAEVTDHAPL